MSDWFATPHGAMAAAGREGRLAVVDLYQRAHLLDYAPMLVTDRELAESWGVGRRVVWSVLDRLEAAGFVDVQRADPRTRKPSRIVVHPPVRQKAPEREPEREPEHTPYNGHNPPPRASTGTSTGASPAPPHAESFACALLETRRDETRSDVSAAKRGRAREANPLKVAELLALQEQDEPQHGMRPQRDLAALSRALLRGSTVEALRWLWDWSGQAPDAEACRKGDWRRWAALLKHPLGDERLQAAERWHRAGRPTSTGPPNRASPGKPYRVADDPTFATREPP